MIDYRHHNNGMCPCEDIYADDHPLTIVKNLKLDEFGFGLGAFPNVMIVFGVNLFDRSTASPFDPTSKGTFSFNDAFNFTSEAQVALSSFCAELRNSSFVLNSEINCFIEEWASFTGQTVPIDRSTLPSFVSSQGASVYIHSTTGEVVFFVVIARLSERNDAPLDARLNAIRGIERMAKSYANTDLSEGFVTYFFYTW